MGSTVSQTQAQAQAQAQPHHHPPPSPPLQSSPPPPEPAEFTCEICIEPIPTAQKFRNSSLCSHNFCTDCITKYIAIRVTDDSLSDVPCPFPDCPLSLDPLTCRPHLQDKIFTKWSDNLCEKAILGWARCYCPYRECSAVVVSECGGEVRKATCPNCKRAFCFKCGVKWHAGYMCEESGGIRDENDVAFGVLAEARRWKRCPRCSHCVELIEGCSIVKCRCGTNFCYMCGRKVNHHWCNCDRTMMWRVICLRILVVIIYFFLLCCFVGAANKLTQCRTSFCYKCGKKVNRHWCDCDRTAWRALYWRIFVLNLIFLFLTFLFGVAYKLAY